MMADQDSSSKSGVVDPETLYTKQSCIGMFLRMLSLLACSLDGPDKG
jgi:hypothetical protein